MDEHERISKEIEGGTLAACQKGHHLIGFKGERKGYRFIWTGEEKTPLSMRFNYCPYCGAKLR